MRDHNKEYQDSKARKYSYDFDTILRDYMIKSFMPFVKKDGTTLEMGCFKGDFTTLISKEVDDLTVVEAASELIEETKLRIGNDSVKFVHSMFEEANFSAEFDNIFLIHTLEHLDDDIGVLKKVKKWLKDDGQFIVGVPNANAPSRQLAVKMGLMATCTSVTEAEREHGHRKTYNFDTLEEVVKAAGLNIKHRGGIFFKTLANFQIDAALKSGIITKDYLDACYDLGEVYPDLSATIFIVCSK